MHRYVTSPSSLVGRAPLTLLGLVVLSIVLTMLVSSASSSIAWRGDFETGNFSQWSLGVQAKDPSRVTIVKDVVRQGSEAARFEVRPGDNNVAGSGSGERSEVLVSSSATGGNEGAEAYWAWSTYFPSTFDSPGGGWNAFTQFHHTGSTGQSPIHFAVNDKTKIALRVMGGDANSPVRKDFDLASLERGRWYDFVFHVKWSSSPAVGFVEVWVNGNLAVPRTTTPTLYAGQGVYAKQGYYRSAYGGTTVVYHDGMRRGSSYADVASDFGSVAEPAPPPLSVTQSITSGSTLRGTTTWTAASTGATLVRFKVDGVVVGTDTTAPFSMSLATDRLDDGQHAFRVEATDASGQAANASVSANVANSAAADGNTSNDTVGNTSGDTTGDASGDQTGHTQNVSDGLSLAGTFAWTATPKGTKLSRVYFSIDGKRVASDRRAPYGVTVDTRTLSDDVHRFETRAIAANGGSSTASAAVRIANRPIAQARPSAPSTFGVTQSMSDGQVLSGELVWTAAPAGREVDRVEFSIDGRTVSTERLRPYVFGGDDAKLDTRKLSNGAHSLAVKAFASDGSTATAVVRVTVSNGVPSSAPSTPAPATPPPAPPAPPTPAPAAAAPSAPAGETTAGGPKLSSSIEDGQSVSGRTDWIVRATGTPVERIEYYIDGKLRWTERHSPFVFGGDDSWLDAGALSKGGHVFELKAYGTNGTVSYLKLRVTAR